MKNKNIIVYILILATLLLFSCKGNTSSKVNQNTPTRGITTVAVDESFSLLMDSQKFTFESIYKYAKVNIEYKPELQVIDMFMKDSVQVILTTKKLTKDQEEYLVQRQIIPKTTKIAYDGLALIINKSNTDTLLKYFQVKDILKGNIDKWDQISSSNGLGKIKIVFDNKESGNIRYFNEKFQLNNNFAKNCYVSNNNEDVINYVEKHSNAIGIISVNWISHKQDSISHSFLSRIKVVAITSEFDPDGVDYYRPYQGYLAEKTYPFIREVYMINRETYTGLGSGFLQFVAGEIGQRIILKSKLLPATMPVRVVQIK